EESAPSTLDSVRVSEAADSGAEQPGCRPNGDRYGGAIDEAVVTPQDGPKVPTALHPPTQTSPSESLQDVQVQQSTERQCEKNGTRLRSRGERPQTGPPPPHPPGCHSSAEIEFVVGDRGYQLKLLIPHIS
ncbi:unnamed protein product, partial [Gadus morhua 'NCC']